VDTRNLKAAFFTYFAANAAIFPYFALYYKEIGLSSQQIGLLGGIAPLVMLLAAPLWGGLADALQQHRRLLLLAVSGTIATISLFPFLDGMLLLLPVVIAYAFFNAPIMPMVDNAVLTVLADQRDQYGKQRMWGAVGWGIVATATGALVERTSLRWAFFGAGLLMLSHLAVVSRLPIGAAPATTVLAPATKREGVKLGAPPIEASYRQQLRQLLANPAWLVFLTAIFINGIGMSFTNNFLFLYLQQLQGGETLMGLAVLMASLSELPAFFFADHLLQRWGARGLLSAALLAQAMRMAGYALMPTAWWSLPINLLHGLTFSAMWVAAVSYARAHAPVGLGATAQSVLSAVSMGLAGVVGGLLGGALFASIGAPAMFGLASLTMLLGVGLFVVAARE
jgi:PPP family 3-phenylpropionic acid transporter